MAGSEWIRSGCSVVCRAVVSTGSTGSTEGDQNGGSSELTPGVAHGSLAGAPPPLGAPCGEGAGVAHGSSAGAPPPCCPPPYDEPPCRWVRVTLAVAYFSEGPTS